MRRARPSSSSARGIHHLSSSRIPKKHSRRRFNRRHPDKNGSIISCALVSIGVIFTVLFVLMGLPKLVTVSSGPQKYLRNEDTPNLRKNKSIETTLPEDSIYSITSLPTINTADKLFSLTQLAGRVAIVINVACA